jgi:hypothetical protein
MKTIEQLLQCPTAVLAPMDADETAPRLRRVLFYSGAKVDRFNWFTGEEYDLSFDLGGADLSSVIGAPVLDGHQSYEAKNVIGSVESAERTGRGYEATLRISEAEDVEPIWQRIQEGTLRNVSMGVQILDIELSKDSPKDRKHYMATKWKPYEISVVPLGADPNAQFLMASQRLAAEASTAYSAEKNKALHELALRERRWRVLGRI